MFQCSSSNLIRNNRGQWNNFKKVRKKEERKKSELSHGRQISDAGESRAINEGNGISVQIAACGGKRKEKKWRGKFYAIKYSEVK